MNNEFSSKSKRSGAPFKLFTGVSLGFSLTLLSYLFTSSAFAMPFDTQPVSEDQGHWQALDTRAHVIIYRQDDDSSASSKGVVNVFVNKQYHTSFLAHNRAVELMLCPGEKALSFSIGQLSQHRFTNSKRVDLVSPTLKPTERYYYQVSLDEQGRINARQVPRREAETALSSLELQGRTLSRVVNERSCPAVIYSIKATDVFTHNKNSTTLSHEGEIALSSLEKTIKKEFRELDEVVVKNSSEVNAETATTHPLSQMRANSVMTWLINSPSMSPQYSAQGKDIKNCSSSSGNKNGYKDCLESGRTIDVEVYGARKNVHMASDK